MGPRNQFRGSKRPFDLSTAKSGFYQFGIVRDGGLEKPVVVRDNDGQIERSPKKPKSLVKSIIVK